MNRNKRLTEVLKRNTRREFGSRKQNYHLVWTSRYDVNGEPVMKINDGFVDKDRKVARMVYEWFYNVSLPGERKVFIDCGWPGCVRPKHMSIGGDNWLKTRDKSKFLIVRQNMDYSKEVKKEDVERYERVYDRMGWGRGDGSYFSAEYNELKTRAEYGRKQDRINYYVAYIEGALIGDETDARKIRGWGVEYPPVKGWERQLAMKWLVAEMTTKEEK